MTRTLGAILAAAGATAALGCAEAQQAAIGPGVEGALGGAEMATVGAPGLTDIPFGEALLVYSRGLSDLHAAGAHVDARIRGEILHLATVLDRMPAAAAGPGLRRTAALIRAEEDQEGEPSIEGSKRSLAAAAAELLRIIPSLYAGNAQVAARTREFAGAVSAIDARRRPPDRPGVINALIRAERALASMYAANVTPPPAPLARRSSP